MAALSPRYISRLYHANRSESDGTGQAPYNFTQMRDMKQKATNEQKSRPCCVGVTREKGGEGRMKRVKGVKCMVTEGDWALCDRDTV